MLFKFNLYRYTKSRGTGRRDSKKGVAATDGPSLSLLAVMEAHGNTAPADWKGYRELTDK